MTISISKSSSDLICFPRLSTLYIFSRSKAAFEGRKEKDTLKLQGHPATDLFRPLPSAKHTFGAATFFMLNNPNNPPLDDP